MSTRSLDQSASPTALGNLSHRREDICFLPMCGYRSNYGSQQVVSARGNFSHSCPTIFAGARLLFVSVFGLFGTISNIALAAEIANRSRSARRTHQPQSPLDAVHTDVRRTIFPVDLRPHIQALASQRDSAAFDGGGNLTGDLQRY